MYVHVCTSTVSVIFCCSPFPDGSYEFSSLWGLYLSGDTDKLQVSTGYCTRLIEILHNIGNLRVFQTTAERACVILHDDPRYLHRLG